MYVTRIWDFVGPARQKCLGDDPTRENEEVDTRICGPFRDESSIFTLKPSWDPIACSKLKQQRHLRRYLGAYGANYIQEKASAAFRCSTVVVGALIRDRAEGLVNQISMRAMKLDNIKSGLDSMEGRRYNRFELGRFCLQEAMQ